MEDEIHKAVDAAVSANDSAMIILRDLMNELTRSRFMISNAEMLNEEFKFARMFGIANGTIDSAMISAEMAMERLLNSDSALRSLKGEI